MTQQSKVSPTLSALLSDLGPNERQDAIVIYRSDAPSSWRVRGRLRDLQARLAAVEAQASAKQAQHAVQDRLIEGYRREGERRMPKSNPRPLAVRGLGGSVLPVAKVEVTRATLGALAEQPDVIAVMFPLLLERVIEQGALPVVAIGNDSHGNSSSPGSAYNALSVGAMERLTGGALAVAPFSSGASLSFPGRDPALVVKPELVAPGVAVYSAIPPLKNLEDFQCRPLTVRPTAPTRDPLQRVPGRLWCARYCSSRPSARRPGRQPGPHERRVGRLRSTGAPQRVRRSRTSTPSWSVAGGGGSAMPRCSGPSPSRPRPKDCACFDAHPESKQSWRISRYDRYRHDGADGGMPTPRHPHCRPGD